MRSKKAKKIIKFYLNVCKDFFHDRNTWKQKMYIEDKEKEKESVSKRIEGSKSERRDV